MTSWVRLLTMCVGVGVTAAGPVGWAQDLGGVGGGSDRTAFAEAVPGKAASEIDAPTDGDGRGAGVVARAARVTYLADGVVTVGREDLPAGEAAVVNMAVAQGTRLTTSERAQAELEFEDGSVVRLTPNASVRLDFLGSDSQGNVTVVRVLGGLVYCELRAAKTSRFSVVTAGDTLWPLENATLRVNVDDPPAVYSMLSGKVMVEHVSRAGTATDGGAQSIEGYRTEVRAGESLRSDATNASRYFLATSVPPETWDNWNEGRDQAAANALASETPVRSGFAGSQGYGWSDLDASGTWYDQPDAGPVWQPAEALSVGFDPYGYGSWSYFPGGGYTWASAYSWGWTPYRCGRWRYWDGFGWGWAPDGLCRTNWRYGWARPNVSGGPRGYVAVRVPVKASTGVHPILAGPHPGERPAAGRGPWERRDAGERRIAGVVVAPIAASGHGMTARGGSAVGSALRRDYAVDERTKMPDSGVVRDPARTVVTEPVSAGPGWRAVSTRPEPAAATSGGGVHGLFGHTARAAEVAPIRVDGRGDPYVAAPVQRTGAGGSVTAGSVDRGQNRGSLPGAGQTNTHTQPMPQQGSHPQPVQQSFHSAPSVQAAPRPDMHSSPAVSAPAPAAAAASKK